jgi:iron complex transport system ATP-binding protein
MESLGIHNVSFGYGDRAVLREVSFTVDKREIVGILGPNGAGKTTLLKCILRKEKTGKGDIQILGKSLNQYEQQELGRFISYVPQEIAFPFPYTVFQIVMMGRYPHSSPFDFETGKERELIENVLRKTRTMEFADRPFNEISGGEKQRVLIARALAQEAPLMLLDEPTSNLDIRHTTQILTLLFERRKETGHALLFVTHDLNLAVSLADRVILLKNGEMLGSGPPQEILTLEKIRELYEVNVKILNDPVTGFRLFGYEFKFE